jgi:hypothetical protein
MKRFVGGVPVRLKLFGERPTKHSSLHDGQRCQAFLKQLLGDMPLLLATRSPGRSQLVTRLGLSEGGSDY